MPNFPWTLAKIAPSDNPIVAGPIGFAVSKVAGEAYASFACSRSTYFCTFPVDVFGSGPKTTFLGHL